jgi:hypothetical protein
LADDQLQELYLATANAGATFADCQLDMRQHSGINLIWYSADLTLSRIAYVLEPDLNAALRRSAVYVTDDFGATATDTTDSQRCYLSGGDGNTLVLRNANGSQLSSASTPTARGPGLHFPAIYRSSPTGRPRRSTTLSADNAALLVPGHHFWFSGARLNQAEPLHAMTFQHSQPHGGGL